MLQEKSSALKREHLAHQNLKFLHFLPTFWVTFALLDPDPADQNKSGSETLLLTVRISPGAV